MVMYLKSLKRKRYVRSIILRYMHIAGFILVIKGAFRLAVLGQSLLRNLILFIFLTTEEYEL